ncbi:MAG: DUF6273 domain-containing protein, partial [Oscillospiraceae bacterium]|nr:DUF6273 domain-containing protein [Oscillospiraceae bacterium]
PSTPTTSNDPPASTRDTNPVAPDNSDNTDTAPEPANVDIAIGNVIEFGGYDWRVLDVQDGKALLLSDSVLEERPYNTEFGDITWADCDLRAYLNGEFYDSFSANDRAKIAEVTNTNPDSPWDFTGIGGNVNTPGGADTQDRVFLLSLDEVVKYFGDSGQLSNRPSEDTVQINDEYSENRIARKVGLSGGGATGGNTWWLRSPGFLSYSATSIDGRGNIRVSGDFANKEFSSYVRPALWLEI